MKPYFKPTDESEPNKASTVETLMTSDKKDAKKQLGDRKSSSPVPETQNYPALESASLAFMTRSGRRALRKAAK
jgi:hypothetical protein